ncbi:ribosome biogenesis protein SLX9-domain-containing protein [Lipomyces arxii]|uniref:ribosome biogenesis protein SLX9-domain-containing protein n=1 Tax=Lipomyces arxii TaxID=56418 RepID=UPI0034CF4C40
MAPRRKSPSAIVEARQALRAHTNALKLEAAKAAIARSASENRILKVKQPTKKSKAVEKRATLLHKLQSSSRVSKSRKIVVPVGISKKSKTKLVASSALSMLGSTSPDPVKSNLNDVKILSKSSQRRQVRAEKEKLAGSNMSDLLEALPEDMTTLAQSGEDLMDVDKAEPSMISVKSKDPRLDLTRTRPISVKLQEKASRQEIDRFGKVIAIKEFRENPFATLRGFIQQRI